MDNSGGTDAIKKTKQRLVMTYMNRLIKRLLMGVGLSVHETKEGKLREEEESQSLLVGVGEDDEEGNPTLEDADHEEDEVEDLMRSLQ